MHPPVSKSHRTRSAISFSGKCSTRGERSASSAISSVLSPSDDSVATRLSIDRVVETIVRGAY